jgi:hypothetical protein
MYASAPRQAADIALHHQAFRQRIRCRENRCSLEVSAICSLAVDEILAAPARQVAEMALAHAVGSKVEAAYRHHQPDDNRREITLGNIICLQHA